MNHIRPMLNSTLLLLSTITGWFTKKKLKRMSYKHQHKRILIDCTGVQNTINVNGIQRVVQNMAKELAKIAPEEKLDIFPVEFYNDFIIAKTLSECDGSYPASHRILTIPGKVLKYLKFYSHIYHNVVKTGHNDILLCLSQFPYNKHHAVKYFKYHSKGTLIYMVHDLIPIRYPQFCPNHADKNFSEWIDASFMYTDAYICVSRTTQKDFLSYMQERGISPSDYFIDTIRLGSDITLSSDTHLPVRPLLQNIFAQHPSVYLIVSTIEPRKNHQFLLDTFEKLWENDINTVLLIVGRIGWKINSLVKQIKHHQEFGSKLFMINDANDKEVLYCYQHAKAFLFPSFTEGFGLPIVESLMHGLPVLASDTSIHREVGGTDITYFNLNDVNSLVIQIKAIEQKKATLNVPTTLYKKHIITWYESAHNLLGRIHILNQKIS